MAWDFETDPAFQKDLDWVDAFITADVAPLDHVLGSPYDVADPKRNALVRPLQAKVRARKLWAWIQRATKRLCTPTLVR